ncbi:MAG: hypothetical protein R2771_10385 [Saprospiraceae bacterium]
MNNFDTLEFPAPYFSRLYYSDNDDINSFKLLPSSETTFTDMLHVDTFKFTLNGLNTENLKYYFYAEIESSDGNKFDSKVASSVFLNLANENNYVQLQSDFTVPWSNTVFSFYKKNANDIFQLIGKALIPIILSIMTLKLVKIIAI